MNHNNFFSKLRRKFIYDLGLTAIGISALTSLTKCSNTGKIKNTKAEGKLGIALVGLENYATGQLAPALQETKDCYLAGIVTGTLAKAEKWKSQYNIPAKNIYNRNNQNLGLTCKF